MQSFAIAMTMQVIKLVYTEKVSELKMSVFNWSLIILLIAVLRSTQGKLIYQDIAQRSN